MNSYENFLMSYGSEILAMNEMLKRVRSKVKSGELDETQVQDALESRIEGMYDPEVAQFIDRVVGGYRAPEPTAIADVAHTIMHRYGTERRQVLNAIEDFCMELGLYSVVDEEDEY